MKPTVQIKILDQRLGTTWQMPDYASAHASGLDLIACLQESITLKPGQTELIPSGISIYLQNPGYCALILPRSGLGHKKGIVLGNLTGLIDPDYQGPLMVSCWNRSDTDYTIEPGERIAQMIVVPVIKPSWQVVTSFDETTERHEGGFGSTGTSATHKKETT